MSTAPTAPSPFRILSLSAKNFKCIEAVEISTKDGQPIVITGDNGAGKSSLLDSILFALTGQGTETPLKKGEKRGVVTLDLGDSEKTFTVTRKFTAKDDSLILTQADESSVPKAQTVLNGMFSSLTIDPLAFMGMKAKAQGEALKDILGVRDVLEKLSQEEKEIFDKRTLVNAKVKALQGQVDGIKVAPGTPDATIDVADVAKQIEEITAIQQTAANAVREFSQAGRELQAAQRNLETIQTRIAQLKKEEETALQQVKSLETAELAANANAQKQSGIAEEKSAQLEALRAKLTTAQATNQAVADKQRRRKLAEELRAAEKEAEDLTEKITKKRDDKTAVVQNAKPPVEGLELTDDGLMYNGLPLSDQNTATQIRVCCALAMAEKPDVRILFIREGALTNAENKQVIFDLAKENKYQVWMEVFSEEEKAGAIHIKAGEIVADNRK